jgi:hypothetical protein
MEKSTVCRHLAVGRRRIFTSSFSGYVVLPSKIDESSKTSSKACEKRRRTAQWTLGVPHSAIVYTGFSKFSIYFYDKPCWKSITACYQRDSFGSTYIPAVAGQNLPRF